MNEKLYSIIVPVFGVEQYIEKCIKSLTDQTYCKIEIILVDDGSKDSSGKICDEFALRDSRITVIHKENGGLVSARKAGAEIARGEYVFCVDGDDWVSNMYIECFDRVISEHAPDIVACGYFEAFGDSFNEHRIFLSEGYYSRNMIEREIIPMAIEGVRGEMFPPQLWAKAFKNEAYKKEQLSVSDKIRIGEDGAVVKPLLIASKSVFIMNECLYFYRASESSMTKSRKAHDLLGPKLIREHLLRRIGSERVDLYMQIERRTARDIYTVVYSQFNREESYKNIRNSIVGALSLPEYKTALNNCNYKNIKLRFTAFLLKHKIIFPVYVFFKMRESAERKGYVKK